VVRLLRHDLHTLTGAYALDAVDSAERERFEHHLQRCPSCEHEVRGMQETATRLAIAVAEPPPPGFKAAVLTAAAQTRQHPPLVDARPEPAADQLPEPALQRSRHRHGGARRRRPFRLAIPVAALATAIVIALGVVVGVQQSRLDQAQNQQRAAQAQQRELTAVLSAPDARIVSGATALGGHTTMVVAASLDKMVFTAAGLPAQPDARVYQLWLLTPSGQATSSGLLPSAGGGAAASLIAAGPPAGDKVAVTVEPAGGTRQPTTKPIVVLSVPS
jgi:anti-sigma-K factor RskA